VRKKRRRLGVTHSAHEIEPFRPIRRLRTERIERFDFLKMTLQTTNNLLFWKGDFTDLFMEQSVTIPILVFENFDIPFEYSSSSPGHFDDGQIAIKPSFPGGTTGETPQFAECINIKNKNSVVFQMQRNASKDFPPI
jgi:hypothetical protein